MAVIPSNAATSPCSTSTTGRRSSKEACPSAECGTEVGTPGTRKRSESGGTLSDTRPGWEQDTSLRAFLLRGHVSAVRVLPLGSYLPALDEILTFGLPDHGMVPPEVLESLVCAAKAERAQEAQAERASAGGGLSDESAAPSIESDVWAAGRMLLEVASGLPGGGEGWHREVLSCCLLPAAADRPSVATLRGLFADACA